MSKGNALDQDRFLGIQLQCIRRSWERGKPACCPPHPSAAICLALFTFSVFVCSSPSALISFNSGQSHQHVTALIYFYSFALQVLPSHQQSLSSHRYFTPKSPVGALRSPVMLPVPSHGSLVVACIFAILALVLQTVDTVIQYCTRQKRSNYLPARILLLLVIFFADVGLISFIVVDKSKKGTRWVAAIWVLVQSSMLLELFLETLLFLRICDGLNKDRGTRKLARILVFSLISIVLIFIILANTFALVPAQAHNQTTIVLEVQSHSQPAIVLQVLGCFFTHMFASLFPLWVLGRGGALRKRKSRGLLSCSSCSLLAAIASLGLLGLPGIYSKYLGELIVMFVSLIPWIVLQGYKLTKVDHKSTEILEIGMGPIEDITEPSVMDHELQVDSNGLVSKIEDLEDCRKVDSWGLDSSTTVGERLS